MKVLFVASHNKGYYAPFIVEQANALRRVGCEVELYGVIGKGLSGYVKCFPALKKKIKSFNPDVVHAHYGLSGLLANMQRRVPVVTTYHGSDINEKSVLPFSKLAIYLSRFNIFVSQRTLDIARPCGRFALIPCGVDLNDLQLTPGSLAKQKMGLEADKRYVLFAGAFDNVVKNYPLAKSVIELVPDAELLELKGYTREQVTLLMCAADALLVTSFSEGSPQVVKEAMACGCPIVSVDVGDVRELTERVPGSFICERTPESLSRGIVESFGHGRTDGRCRIVEMGLVNDLVADKIFDIYKKLR